MDNFSLRSESKIKTDLFSVQPESCREQLPYKELDIVRYRTEKEEKYNRKVSLINKVMFTDPSPFFKKIIHTGNPLQRINPSSNVGVHILFPNESNGICACGCGEKLQGRRRRWATDVCSDYPFEIYSIISGRTDTIRKYLWYYQYGHCAMCGDELCGSWQPHFVHDYDCDHIHPVHKGGGCCWLSNYQLLHRDCHKEKTRIDLTT